MADERVVIEFTTEGGEKVVAMSRGIDKALDGVDSGARKASGGLGVLEKSITKATAVGTLLGNMAYDIGARLVSGLVGAIGQSITMAAKLQTTLAGLTGIAGAFGIGADEAKKAALSLSKDGLMKVEESAAGLKNLLATGFSLPESIQLMNVFKDSAAFGAQGFYSVGQASVRATEGIKFGNSALTDSTGLGKNLSVIMREAGLSETMAGQAASNHAVRRAILNGFLKEGALFTGQAEMKSKTFAGQQERLANTYDMLLASIGSYIVENKAVVDLMGLLGNKLVELMNWLAEAGRGYDFVTSAILMVIKAMDGLLLVVDLGMRAWALTNISINATVAIFMEASKAILGYQLAMLKAIAAVPGATSTIGGLSDAVASTQGNYDLASSAALNYGNAAKANFKTIAEGSPAINAMRSTLAEATVAIEAARGKTVELGESKKRDTTATGENGKAHKAAKTDIEQYTKSMQDLNKEITAASKRGVSDAEIIKRYGDRMIKAGEDAAFFKVNLQELAPAVKKLGDEAKKLELRKYIGEAMIQAAGDVRQAADAIFTAMREKVQASIAGVTQAMTSNHAIINSISKKVEDEERKRTNTSVQYRQWQLREERDAVLASLDVKDAAYADHVAKVNGYYDTLLNNTMEQEQATQKWADSLASIVDLMSQIAQATGNKALGNMVGTLGAFAVAQKSKAQFGGSNWGIGGALKNADGSRNWGNTAAAGAGLAQGAVGVWQATDVAGRGNRAWAGAKAGAQAGAMFGPYGALIGMGVGALVGALRNPGFEQEMKRVSRDFGVNISEELARAIDKNKKKFGGDRTAAEIDSLDKIVAEGGGVNDKNVGKLTGKLRDIFVMLETGKFTAEQAKETLEKSFPAFATYIQNSTRVASQAFQDVIALNRKFGTESKAVLDFVMGQTARAGASMAGLLAPLQGEYSGLADKIATTKARLEDMGKAGTASASELKAGQAELAKLTKLQTEGAAKAKDELVDLGLIAVGTYNAARNAGMSEVEAVKAVSGSLAGLKQMYADLGLAIEDEATAALIAYADRVQANSALVEQAGLLNETMLATSNIGALNEQTFMAMQRQGMRTYDRLIAAGFSENESLSIMKDYLNQVQNAHKDLGLPIDENTQKLIDQANKAGILKGAQETMNDIMKEGLGAIIELLGGKLPEAWQKAQDAAKSGTDKATDGLAKAATQAGYLQDKLAGANREMENLGNNAAGAGGGDYGGGSGDGGGGSAGTSVHTGGYVGRYGAIQRYHKGGMVGLSSGEVPAVLQQGEFVINRSAVGRVGKGALHAINRGMVGSGNGGSGSSMDPQAIGKAIVDELQKRGGLRPVINMDGRVLTEEVASRIGDVLEYQGVKSPVWRP